MNISTFAAAAAIFLAHFTALAGPVDDLIAKGEVFDRKFNATEALKYYLPAEKLSPNDARILVMIARQYRHLMTDAPAKEEKLRLGAIALKYSERAAALAPTDSDAQLAIAITHGKMLAYLGNKEKAAASPIIKASADKALALDPRNDTAWYILGRWHRALADIGSVKRAMSSLLYGKLPTTTNAAAVACFEQAIKIDPNRLMFYVELGRTYGQMGQKDEARRLIEKALAMPDVEKDDPEAKQRGREALESYK